MPLSKVCPEPHIENADETIMLTWYRPLKIAGLCQTPVCFSVQLHNARALIYSHFSQLLV
jgi:hypothetical protein